MSGACPQCRDTAQVVDFDGRVSPCTEPECVLRQERIRALDLVAAGAEAADVFKFKGGAFKVSIQIKGYEISAEEHAALRDLIANNEKFRLLKFSSAIELGVEGPAPPISVEELP